MSALEGDTGVDALRRHVEMLHALAGLSCAGGKLVLASYGEDPATGAVLAPKVLHFAIGDVGAMVAAAERLGGEAHRNVYAPFAVVRADLPAGKKGGEDDIVAVLGLVGDFDDAEASRWRERMPAPADYALETSAGRFQAFLPFDRAVAPADAKKLAEALAAHAGCDTGTKDVSHIWRLPGTLNWPNKKKLAAGRPASPQPVRVAQPWAGTRTSVAALGEALEAKPEAKPNGVDPDANVDVDALPISERMRNLIRGVDDREHPYPSRSERVFAVLVAMAGAGLSDGQMAAVFLDGRHPISAHVLEHKDPKKALARQIAKAREAAVDPEVAKLNKEHAVVVVGDKTAILWEGASPDGGPPFKLIAVSTFQMWYRNQFIEVGKDKAGNARWITVADRWLSHRERRQYKGLVFAPKRVVPGYYNFWRGFAVEPKAGDCSKFLAHLHDNICRGDEANYRWTVGWFADIFQHPGSKCGTSLAIRGEPGVGKTKVGETVGSLLGPHYLLVADQRYIVGRFNSHMVACLLLHADEGFWAGDHKVEGIIRDFITGDMHPIEFKGKEAVWVKNYGRLLVTAQDKWVVPAAMKERRFATLDAGDKRIQDHAYFAAIDKEMNEGGREALLDFFLKYDLTGINLREIPKTAALLDQQISSLPPEEGWWMDVLKNGRLPYGCGVAGQCPTALLFDSYIKHATGAGARRRSIETTIGIFLAKNAPGLTKSEATYTTYGGKSETGSVYTFPPLAECRAAFDRLIGQKVPWGEPTEWREDPTPPEYNRDPM